MQTDSAVQYRQVDSSEVDIATDLQVVGLIVARKSIDEFMIDAVLHGRYRENVSREPAIDYAVSIQLVEPALVADARCRKQRCVEASEEILNCHSFEELRRIRKDVSDRASRSEYGILQFRKVDLGQDRALPQVK